MPESIARFFDGEPMAGKADKLMGEMVADNFLLAFVGPHALMLPPLDKAHFGEAAGGLMTSFPDLTFNLEKATPTQKEDGSWAADIIVMGTHTGPAYSPMPGKLPPVETSNKQVKIGPETFKLFADASGQICKIMIVPLEAGRPQGPPGFYGEIGGDLHPLVAAVDAGFAGYKAQTDIVFGMFDADNSGFIEEAEGHALAHYMDNSDKAAFWAHCLNVMDTDGDGKVSKLEYATYLFKSGMSIKEVQDLKVEIQNKKETK